MADKKTCFVVMGFGKKTDHRQGKTFDLDKTYANIIKPAVEEAGLECIRADEIQHSGVIDLPMYEQLLNADVVVADLSTANFNAAYELGVRHGLKPYSTIAMAEKGFSFPFDVNHILFLTYEHLESGIDFDEVMRMRESLTNAVKAATTGGKVDSPVYTFLHGLTPPSYVAEGAAAAPRGVDADAPRPQKQTIAALRALAEAYKADSEWDKAAETWGSLADQEKSDPFFVQQYALATYKAAEKKKDVPAQPRAGYLEAVEILESLNPERSGDPETLGIWAAVHKRLYEKGEEPDEEVRAHYLDQAITALQKGFFILNDYYNGINLAYMLDVRGAASDGDDAVTDHTMAHRVRAKVAEICQVLAASGDYTKDDEYWVKATAWEAYVGLGDEARAEEWKAKALAVESFQGWMRETTEAQIARLQLLLPG